MASACPGIVGVSQVCSVVGGAVSHVVGFGADQVLNSIGAWVVAGATWLLGRVGDAMSATTAPQLGAGWFTAHYRVMMSVAAVAVVPMLLASVMRAVARQDLSGLIRSALVHLPLALLFSAVVIEVVQLSLSAVDALSSTVASSTGSDVKSFLTTVADSLGGSGSGPAAPVFVTFLGGLVVAFGAFALWLELILRAASVYVAVLFMPLALAALVWPATSHWCRRLAETLAALILSKFVIVAVISLAAGALSGEGSSGSFTGVIAGSALLLLATLAPYALLKIVPAVEAGAVSQLEGLSRRAGRVVASAPGSAASVLLSGGTGGALAGATGAVDVPMATGLPESVAHERMAAAAATRSGPPDDEPGHTGGRPASPGPDGGPGGGRWSDPDPDLPIPRPGDERGVPDGSVLPVVPSSPALVDSPGRSAPAGIGPGPDGGSGLAPRPLGPGGGRSAGSDGGPS